MTEESKKARGFARLSPEQRHEISRLGGKAAHAKGTAHEFTHEEAQRAGRKGGYAAHRARPHPPQIATAHTDEAREPH